MRSIQSAVFAGALLAFGGPALAHGNILGSSQQGAHQVKKKMEKKVEKHVEKKTERTEDGAKKEEKMEHTEHSEGEAAPSPEAEGSH